MKNDKSAFPLYATEQTSEGSNVFFDSGMTLLDYFAAQAIQGQGWNGGVDDHKKETAKRAYDLAEAMLAEREKRINY